MNLRLAVQQMRQQSLLGIVDSNAGFVAGTLNAQYFHVAFEPVKPIYMWVDYLLVQHKPL